MATARWLPRRRAFFEGRMRVSFKQARPFISEALRPPLWRWHPCGVEKSLSGHSRPDSPAQVIHCPKLAIFHPVREAFKSCINHRHLCDRPLTETP